MYHHSSHELRTLTVTTPYHSVTDRGGVQEVLQRRANGSQGLLEKRKSFSLVTWSSGVTPAPHPCWSGTLAKLHGSQSEQRTGGKMGWRLHGKRGADGRERREGEDEYDQNVFLRVRNHQRIN